MPEKMLSEMRISSTRSGGPVRARNAPGRDLNLDVLDRRTREERERSFLMQETGTFDRAAPRGQGTLRRSRRPGHRPRESAVWHSTLHRAPRPGARAIRGAPARAGNASPPEGGATRGRARAAKGASRRQAGREPFRQALRLWPPPRLSPAEAHAKTPPENFRRRRLPGPSAKGGPGAAADSASAAASFTGRWLRRRTCAGRRCT